MPKLSNEQFWKLYEMLPQELKDALFSEGTGDNIYDVCQRYEIGDNLAEVVDLVGQVLVGVLPTEDFQKVLETDLKFKTDFAKKVSREINRFIFYPVKPALEELYKVGVATPEEKLAEKPEAEPETKVKPKLEPAEPPGKDTYREPIE